MTQKEFAIGVNIIQIMTQKKFAKDQMELYYRFLKRLDGKQFEIGLEKMFNSRVYSNIPMVAEILEYCEDRKDIESIAMIASDELKKAIFKLSMYDSVAFSDPVQHKIIESLGGWIKCHTLPVKEVEDFFKFEYVKKYKAYASRGTGEIPLVLVGKHDANNNVVDVKPKHVIGSPERYNAMCIAYEKRYNNNQLESNLKSIGVE